MYDDSWGESGRHLLEVMLEMTESELAAHAQEAIADESEGDEEEDWRQEPAEEVRRMTWYKIPAAVVNSRGTVRHIPPDQIESLFDE